MSTKHPLRGCKPKPDKILFASTLWAVNNVSISSSSCIGLRIILTTPVIYTGQWEYPALSHDGQDGYTSFVHLGPHGQ